MSDSTRTHQRTPMRRLFPCAIFGVLFTIGCGSVAPVTTDASRDTSTSDTPTDMPASTDAPTDMPTTTDAPTDTPTTTDAPTDTPTTTDAPTDTPTTTDAPTD